MDSWGYKQNVASSGCWNLVFRLLAMMSTAKLSGQIPQYLYSGKSIITVFMGTDFQFAL